jgi:hypothetical protein
VFDDAAFLLGDKFYELHLDKHGKEQLAPAVALRAAQDWLRHVTYGELKTIFPVRHDASGAYLELYAAPRITKEGTQTIRPFSLPLGADDDCPYARPARMVRLHPHRGVGAPAALRCVADRLAAATFGSGLGGCATLVCSRAANRRSAGNELPIAMRWPQRARIVSQERQSAAQSGLAKGVQPFANDPGFHISQKPSVLAAE